MGFSLVLLVVNTALQALASSGKIPMSVSSLVTALGPIVGTAITNIENGTSKLGDVVTALGAMSAALAVLKAQTGLDPAILDQINVYDQAVQAGISGYLDSKNGVDLSKLSPVAPIA